MLYKRKDAPYKMLWNEESDAGMAASIPPMLKHLLASALSASPVVVSSLCHLRSNLFLAATTCQRLAELFLSYSQSPVRASHILAVVAPFYPPLPPPEPPQFHFGGNGRSVVESRSDQISERARSICVVRVSAVICGECNHQNGA